jgi:hypothetical protein
MVQRTDTQRPHADPVEPVGHVVEAEWRRSLVALIGAAGDQRRDRRRATQREAQGSLAGRVQPLSVVHGDE